MKEITGKSLKRGDAVVCLGANSDTAPALVYDVSNNLVLQLSGCEFVINSCQECLKLSNSQKEYFKGTITQLLARLKTSTHEIGSVLRDKNLDFYVYLGKVCYTGEYILVAGENHKSVYVAGGGNHCYIRIPNAEVVEHAYCLSDLFNPVVVGYYNLQEHIVCVANKLLNVEVVGQLGFSVAQESSVVAHLLRNRVSYLYRGEYHNVDSIWIHINYDYTMELLKANKEYISYLRKTSSCIDSI